jgi:hypothetical protein
VEYFWEREQGSACKKHSSASEKKTHMGNFCGAGYKSPIEDNVTGTRWSTEVAGRNFWIVHAYLFGISDDCVFFSWYVLCVREPTHDSSCATDPLDHERDPIRTRCTQHNKETFTLVKVFIITDMARSVWRRLWHRSFCGFRTLLAALQNGYGARDPRPHGYLLY